MSNTNDFAIENGTLKQYVGPGGDVVIPEGVKELENGAFSRYRNITSVTFSKELQCVPDGIFYASEDVFREAVVYDTYPGTNLSKLTSFYQPEKDYIVTVKSAETDDIQFRILLCLGTESETIREVLEGAWSPYAVFNFKAIDQVFSGYKTMQNRILLAKMRLDYPVDLDDEMKRKYRSFIKRNGYKLFPDVISTGNEELAQWLIKSGTVGEKRINELIELAQKSQNTTITAMLMDYKKKNFGDQDANLELADLELSEDMPKLWEVKDTAPELIWRYNGLEEQLTFPTELDGVRITGIADTESLKPENYRNIEKVVIPEGYKSIGKNAFSSCVKLKKVVLPRSLEYLGDDCFAGCSSLESINLPEGLRSIPHGAFSWCSQLKKIVFPESLFSMGNDAFRGCSSLREIELGENVRYLDRSFYMTNLETVIYRGKKCSCGDSPCFSYPRYVYTDGEIDAVGIPRASWMPLSYLGLKNEQLVKNAGDSYLKGLSVCSLGQLKAFPKISDYRYSNMTFADFVSSLGGTYSNKLTKTTDLLVTFLIDPENATIQRAVKQGTVVLTELDLLKLIQAHKPLDLTSWKTTAAAETEGKTVSASKNDPYRAALMKKLWGYTELNDGTIRLNSYKGEETEVEIPPRIGSQPVSMIGKGALSPRGPRANNPQIRAGITKVLIPDSITGIEEEAFEGCKELRELQLSQKLCSIGRSAFCNCESLTEIEIPNTVTEIGWHCFEGCERLSRAVLPEGLKTVESELFRGCRSLKAIEIPETVRNIGWEAFKGCRMLKGLELPASVTGLGDGAFTGCEGLADENGWVILGNVLFGYYGAETELAVPAGITAVSMNFLKENDWIRKVILPEGIRRIGRNAFENCTALEKVVLPDSIEEIGFGAFRGCGCLKEIRIPAGLKKLSSDTFKNCIALKEMTLPASLETVDGSPFSGCNALETVTVLGKDTRFEKGYIMGDLVFDNCSALKVVYTPKPDALPLKYRVLAEKT